MALNPPQVSHDTLSRHALIVDDYAPNILIASIFMNEFGYTYDVARNGFEAVDCIKSNKYGIVIMDVQMPYMCGLEATRIVRAYENETGKTPVKIIAVTAQALPIDRDRCLEAGMNDYLSKPFHADELKKKIEVLMA